MKKKLNVETSFGTKLNPKTLELNIKTLPAPDLNGHIDNGFQIYKPTIAKFEFELDYEFYQKVCGGDEDSQVEFERIISELTKHLTGQGLFTNEEVITYDI